MKHALPALSSGGRRREASIFKAPAPKGDPTVAGWKRRLPRLGAVLSSKDPGPGRPRPWGCGEAEAAEFAGGGARDKFHFWGRNWHPACQSSPGHGGFRVRRQCGQHPSRLSKSAG